jgi:hypothetical protein
LWPIRFNNWSEIIFFSSLIFIETIRGVS